MFTLEDIKGIGPNQQTAHRVCALAKDDKSPVLNDLQKFRKKHFGDYKKIIKVLRLLGQNARILNEKQVKQCDTKDVYEAIGGQIRLFFFYIPDSNQAVICTNCYWKAKDSRQEQDKAIAKCNGLRKAYLESLGLKTNGA